MIPRLLCSLLYPHPHSHCLAQERWPLAGDEEDLVGSQAAQPSVGGRLGALTAGFWGSREGPNHIQSCTLRESQLGALYCSATWALPAHILLARNSPFPRERTLRRRAARQSQPCEENATEQSSCRTHAAQDATGLRVSCTSSKCSPGSPSCQGPHRPHLSQHSTDRQGL